MNPERWQQVERLYHAALEQPPADRGVFLVKACAGDEGLQREVASLLAYDDPEGSFIESPGFEAPNGCRDTTGAGDAFRGGFLYGLLKGEDIETSLKFGNAVAAIKCSSLGARTALPTRSELEEFLRV